MKVAFCADCGGDFLFHVDDDGTTFIGCRCELSDPDEFLADFEAYISDQDDLSDIEATTLDDFS